MCHSSTRPGTSYHVTQFYQAIPRVNTASDKRWGEKAWVRGYLTSKYKINSALTVRNYEAIALYGWSWRNFI